MGTEGKIIPHRTEGSHRLYRLSQFKMSKRQTIERERKTIAYARVSSGDQKSDLERQKKGDQSLSIKCQKLLGKSLELDPLEKSVYLELIHHNNKEGFKERTLRWLKKSLTVFPEDREILNPISCLK